MTIIIQEINDREQWNGFVASQPSGHILQSYEWGELNKYQGRRIHRLGALEDGRMVGALLLAVTSVPLPVTVPGLRTDWLYGLRGPVVEAPDSPALAALVEFAHKLARQEHAVILRLEPNVTDDMPDMQRWVAAFHQLGFRDNPHALHPRRSWALDIRPSPEQLLADFKMTWRQNVRIAERKGVTVREAVSDADFDSYYDLLKITSERDDFLVLSKDYHKEVLRQFASQGHGVLYLAEHEGEAVAAKMLLRFGDWCVDMFGASSNNKRNLKPTYLLQYRCFLWAKEQGCSFFDFRAIPEILEPGEEMWGVYEYKRGFSGYSRLCLPTQDYVYRPLIYRTWRTYVDIRRKRLDAAHKKAEQERVARSQSAKEKEKLQSVKEKV
ncbi:MAG: peptidoglycan bridge formation glycyltransferase FemA/FemB family protein [Chloroflexota bacterium]|nr:peptidoglycan bridge formation glycyltransferase FemA/FemB family protein [Chloroflexota bacterium]